MEYIIGLIEHRILYMIYSQSVVVYAVAIAMFVITGYIARKLNRNDAFWAFMTIPFAIFPLILMLMLGKAK